MNITRTLAAAVAIAAIAAPVAQARPADIYVPPAPQERQDLRSPDARDAARHSRPIGGPVDAPGATAVDSATRPGSPQPITTSAAVRDDSGAHWTTIALGVGGLLVAIAGTVALAGRRSRRLQRLRVPA